MSGNWRKRLEEEVLPYLAPGLQRSLGGLLETFSPLDPWREIRLGVGQPLAIRAREWILPGIRTGPEDLARTVELVTRGSRHALERELGSGFLTLPGGHRVGLAGRYAGGTLRDISHLCFRLALEHPGSADPLLPLVLGGPRPASTLLAGPPGSGKTTLLRDLIRSAAARLAVAVVDERMELSGFAQGKPSFDLGPLSAVVGGKPKAEAAMDALRSLGPEVLATDEVAGEEEAAALLEAARGGVALLATAHGSSPHDLLTRPSLRLLLREGAFLWVFFLSSVPRPGTVTSVWRWEEGGNGHLGSASSDLRRNPVGMGRGLEAGEKDLRPAGLAVRPGRPGHGDRLRPPAAL